MPLDLLFSWGQAPKPPGSASPRTGLKTVFCEAELMVLLLFSYFPGSALLRFGQSGLLRSRTNAFASFLEKKNTIRFAIFRGRICRGLGTKFSAENFASFLEKKNTIRLDVFYLD
jgi:hypothetical protein